MSYLYYYYGKDYAKLTSLTCAADLSTFATEKQLKPQVLYIVAYNYLLFFFEKLPLCCCILYSSIKVVFQGSLAVATCQGYLHHCNWSKLWGVVTRPTNLYYGLICLVWELAGESLKAMLWPVLSKSCPLPVTPCLLPPPCLC